MTTINGSKHEVSTALVDAVASRLNARLIHLRNMSRQGGVDALAVVSEIKRLYPALDQKIWFKDFVVQFCRDRHIHIDPEGWNG